MALNIKLYLENSIMLFPNIPNPEVFLPGSIARLVAKESAI